MTHVRRYCVLLPTLVILGACRDLTPTTPALEPEELPIGARFDATSGTAPLSMGWLPPLGSAAPTTPQDLTLRPTVSVCRWKDGACVGSPVAQFAVGSGLAANSDGFSALWSLTAATMPPTRTTFRIAVTNGATLVGLPILVEAMRGRWALAVPGQTPVLIVASGLPLQFRLGTASAPPPPLAIVATGVQSAGTQFFPLASSPGETRTSQQVAALTNLATNLTALNTALSGPPEVALLALTQARSAADAAFRVAPAGDKADLDVIRLELDQAGRLLGVSG